MIEKDGFSGYLLARGLHSTKPCWFNAELWDHLKEAKEFGIEASTPAS